MSAARAGQPSATNTGTGCTLPAQALRGCDSAPVSWSTECYHNDMIQEMRQRDLRNQSGEIMRELDDGNSCVITRNGVPVGELTSLHRHRFVTAAAAVALFKNAPQVDLARRPNSPPGHTPRAILTSAHSARIPSSALRPPLIPRPSTRMRLDPMGEYLPP